MARHRFSAIGAGLALMVGVWILLNIVLSNLVPMLIPAGSLPGQGGEVSGYPTWLSLLISSGPLYLIAMPLAVLVFRGVPALTTRRFSLSGLDTATLLLGCLPVMIAGNFIGIILSSAISGGQSTNRVANAAVSGGILTNFLFMVILAPLFEEWIFRKQIIDRTRVYGEKASIVLSALAFALFHLNLYQFFYAFGLGLILGYAYMRTSRIGYPIIFHMLINFNGAVLAPWLMSLFGDRFWDAYASAGTTAEQMQVIASVPSGAVMALTLYGFAFIGLAFAGLILLIVRRKSFHFYETPLQLPAGGQGRAIYSTPGILVFLVLGVVLTAVMTFL